MTTSFPRITIEQFAQLLSAFPFKRRVTAVHVHHTWRPNHDQWKKYGSEHWIRSMADYHTSLGWGTIAQHLTIDPDGGLWKGRDWNAIPASAKGNNGTASDGPFMIEIAGDFDKGKDALAGTQFESVIVVLAHLLARFGLDEGAIRFHRQLTTAKSCPGTSVDRTTLAEAVRKAKKQVQAPQSRAATMSGPFGIEASVLYALLGPPGLAARETVDDELPEEEHYGLSGHRSAPTPLEQETMTADELAELIPHVINMREGRFSKTENFQSDEGTVDAIFADLDSRAASATAQDPLRIVLWAHGGLISEEAGFRIAHKHVWWWKKSNVYPLYFVWETGLGTAIKDTLSRAWERLRGKRGFDIFEHTTDMALVGIVRTLQGRHVWSGMKYSAKASAEPGNAGDYVAQHLGALVTKYDGAVELHALGHSAGSIFHAHFVPSAIQHGAHFRTLQFLAPAIRADEYLKRLDSTIGNGVTEAAIYTMRRSFERADTCAGVYRKSLLYLISHALEVDVNAEILGLDETLHGNKALAQRFGLRGPGKQARIVWSVTPAVSESRTHGGFDDDPATMNDIAAAVLEAQPAVPYPETRKRSIWEEDGVFGNSLLDTDDVASAPPMRVTSDAGDAPSGRRRALCVGINDYPAAPLSGCVADATAWAAGLRTLGFECEMLLEGQATRAAILAGIQRLVSSSTPGDVLVFQAAGHGMNVPDLDGDEGGGPDEAFCPHDYETGALLIDDDIATVFAAIPPGVVLTCFLDYCHSGSATRLGAGRAEPRAGRDERKRFLRATPAIMRAHEQYRRQNGQLTRAVGLQRDQESMRDVVFSACQSHEAAWESDGSGDFTRNVVPLLARAGTLTNAAFHQLTIAGFQPAGRQHPYMDSSTAMRHAPFLTGAQPRTDDRLPALLREAATRLDTRP